MIFLLKKKKKKDNVKKKRKWKLLREKRCLRVPLTFIGTYGVQKILDCSSWNQMWLVCSGISWGKSLTPPTPNPPIPAHCPWITCTEISGSTMYSNLVWIMCCSLGFLKWYRSRYQISALADQPAPLEGSTDGMFYRRFPTQSQRKLVFLSSSHVIFRNTSLGEGAGEGGLFSLRLKKKKKNKCWLL